MISWKCFVVFGPLVVMTVYATIQLQQIVVNGVPDGYSHGKVVLAGQSIMSVFGSLGAAWNLATFVSYSKWHGRIWFLVSASMDLTVAVFLFIGVGLQSIYLPHFLTGCGSAETWQVEGDGKSLFGFIADLPGPNGDPYSTPRAVCNSFMTVWTIGITMGIMLFICALVSFRLSEYTSDTFWEGLIWLCQVVFTIMEIIVAIISWMVSPIIYNLRFGFRYLQKWRNRNYVPTFVVLPETPSQPPPMRSYPLLWRPHRRHSVRSLRSGRGHIVPETSSRSDERGPCNQPIKAYEMGDQSAEASAAPQTQLSHLNSTPFKAEESLIKLLTSYPIFTSFAAASHYSDLVSLSQASKALQAAIFPTAESAAFLKSQTCPSIVKGLCWSCNKQICKMLDATSGPLFEANRHIQPCMVHVAIPTLPRQIHHLNCAPLCTHCFRTQTCSSSRPRCFDCCTIEPTDGQFLELCGRCANESQETWVARRARREEKALWRARPTYSGLNRCGICRTLMRDAKGPRWWKCGLCNGECPSRLHPGWSTGSLPRGRITVDDVEITWQLGMGVGVDNR